MSGRKSAWNVPNVLTLARVCLIPVFVGLLMARDVLPHARLWAEGVFILASFTDFLDGYIARKYHLITNLGKFMDPLADKLLTLAAFVMLVGMGEFPAWAAILILCRELAVTGFRAVAADRGVVIAAGGLGKMKTVAQMALIILMLPGYDGCGLFIIIPLLFAAVVVLTVGSGIEYIWKNRGVLGE